MRTFSAILGPNAFWNADVDQFYRECDPDKDNLCLYGARRAITDIALTASDPLQALTSDLGPCSCETRRIRNLPCRFLVFFAEFTVAKLFQVNPTADGKSIFPLKRCQLSCPSPAWA